MPPLSGIINHSLNLAVEANPRQVAHGRELADRAADIEQFYESIIGDSPYPSFTLALVESDLPGGHSPAYFAALNQPLPTSPFVWRNDPTAFVNFPEFFAAHEIAHQWWGQAVGWRNYHEQWLSEGFAQYFAAMYAQHVRGDEAFGAVMRQMRKWAMANSDQGPVYLGYRLGHIRGQSRVFRALVYDKGAAVLHMLRRLVGDDAFFRGLQRFYLGSRFKKVGTEDFRKAMEKESGRPLDRFFDRWIYGFSLPKVKFSYRVDGSDVVLHAEQTGEVFDVPLTITLQYADKRVDVIFPVTEQTSEMRVALSGALRGVEVSKDDGTLAEIVRGT
jgi:aminopeptidase N